MTNNRLKRQKAELQRLVEKKAERERAAQPCSMCDRVPATDPLAMVMLVEPGEHPCSECTTRAEAQSWQWVEMWPPRGLDESA